MWLVGRNNKRVRRKAKENDKISPQPSFYCMCAPKYHRLEAKQDHQEVVHHTHWSTFYAKGTQIVINRVPTMYAHIYTQDMVECIDVGIFVRK